MNYGIVAKILGSILIVDASLLLPPLMIALRSGDGTHRAFLLTILVTLIPGILMYWLIRPKMEIRAREGLAIVTLGWVLVSLLGAIPFVATGAVPGYVDALFETISGFTTTGASVIPDVEILPASILFWRSFTHWIGGMGILVFTVALLPALGMGSFHIFRAESPGPVAGRVAPRIRDTARYLYISYVSLTLLEILFLLLGDMSLFDAAVYTFGTVGTGGFAPHNTSLTHFGTYIHLVVSTFMILAGVSFSLHFYLYNRKVGEIVSDHELQFYLKGLLACVLLIGADLFLTGYNTLGISMRDALFQSASIMTTTGYATADFHQWPTFSKILLLVLMFVGGSAGSTAGGMKVIRVLILLKLIRREISKIFHPNAFVPVKLGRKVVPNEVVSRVNSFIAVHLLFFIVGSLVVSLEGVDVITAVSASAATLNNVGPGLGVIGPTGNYSGFSVLTKLVLSFLMLLGRLEIFTVLALLVPRGWTAES